jgi:hypothetical protein
MDSLANGIDFGASLICWGLRLVINRPGSLLIARVRALARHRRFEYLSVVDEVDELSKLISVLWHVSHQAESLSTPMQLTGRERLTKRF